MGVRAVFLVGFMASGKSTVGRELARRLNWEFVDLDAQIESRDRQTIPEIFQNQGESGFRLAETRVLREITESLECDTVVALGGGTFAQAKNRELLRAWPTIFLDVPLDELWQRSLEDPATRPLRTVNKADFARLYESREPFYRQATVTVVTSGRDPASLCAEIERKLQLRGKTRAVAPSQEPPANFGTGESN